MGSSKTWLLLCILAVSCLHDDDDARFVLIPVDTEASTVADTGVVNEDIEAEITVVATNGCYSDLRVELEQRDANHFIVKGVALNHKWPACADVMVYRTGKLTFRAATAGLYYFQMNQAPFDIRIDTIVIR